MKNRITKLLLSTIIMIFVGVISVNAVDYLIYNNTSFSISSGASKTTGELNGKVRYARVYWLNNSTTTKQTFTAKRYSAGVAVASATKEISIVGNATPPASKLIGNIGVGTWKITDKSAISNASSPGWNGTLKYYSSTNSAA